MSTPRPASVVIADLQRTAQEIRRTNIYGWGNVIDEAIATIEQLQGTIKNLQSALQSENEAVQARNATIEQLTQERDTLRSERNSRQNELEGKRTECVNLKAEIGRLQPKADAYDVLKEKNEALIRYLKDENFNAIEAVMYEIEVLLAIQHSGGGGVRHESCSYIFSGHSNRWLHCNS